MSSVTITVAVILVSGKANKYFGKTSMPVSTYSYSVDGNGPTISIWSKSPGNGCNEDNILVAKRFAELCWNMLFVVCMLNNF